MSFVAKLRKWSNYSALHRFDVKTIKNVQWCQKHSKERKTTKLIKLQWIASIWCHNDKKNSKLQTRSNYDQFASIWRQNNREHWGTVAKHSKQRKTTKRIKLQLIASICLQNNPKCWDTSQNYESDQIIVHCIDLTSKRSKLLSYVAKLQNDQIIVHWIDLTSKRFKTFELRPKTTKVIKLQK